MAHVKDRSHIRNRSYKIFSGLIKKLLKKVIKVIFNVKILDILLLKESIHIPSILLMIFIWGVMIKMVFYYLGRMLVVNLH